MYTTFLTTSLTSAGRGEPQARPDAEALERYRRLIDEQRITWTEHYRFIRLLGTGGQG